MPPPYLEVEVDFLSIFLLLHPPCLEVDFLLQASAPLSLLRLEADFLLQDLNLSRDLLCSLFGVVPGLFWCFYTHGLDQLVNLVHSVREMELELSEKAKGVLRQPTYCCCWRLIKVEVD